jgi:hypothetical protein
MLVRIAAIIALILLLVGCQSAPATQIVLVVTATPDAAATQGSAQTESSPAAPAASPTRTVTATTPPTRAETATVSATAAPTATPNIFPTPTTGEIQVAEQLFQNGRMFWVQPTSQIWVLVVRGEGRGLWTIYPDTFDDATDPEVDPSLIAPEGLIQPTRGFGKLWRTNQDVREALGWATTPEFGYVSRYEYHPGGTIQNNAYVPAPGYHILYSLYTEQFRFNEVDSTWQLGGG